jgi:hypothetical protein
VQRNTPAHPRQHRREVNLANPRGFVLDTIPFTARAMKAYLITTGTVFALMAIMHLVRAIAEYATLFTEPGYFLGMTALGMVSASLSIWAWRLFVALRPK